VFVRGNVLDFTLDSLSSYFIENGLKSYTAKQVFDWVYRKYEINHTNWTNISKAGREFIDQNMSVDLPKIIHVQKSTDGTVKFLIGFEDKNTVETVAIFSPGRLTLCLSSQIGCAIGCNFCHTATQGLTRSLHTREVVGQMLAVQLYLKNIDPGLVPSTSPQTVTNLVYMGQGEPLHNFENMKKATEIFMCQIGLGIGQRKITLSTAGLANMIERLVEFPPINLAISLHSARDEVRSELMPINKAHNLEKLSRAIRKFPLKAHRMITYEYLLIKDLTDTDLDVESLSKYLDKKDSKINIIPFNPFPGSKYKRPKDDDIHSFVRKLKNKGFVTTVRITKGMDILAACGQLKSEHEDQAVIN
jgi:23S rRNA (adenine2503-C2)-methyltransferase